MHVFRELYTTNNKNILTFVYWFVFWKVLDNLMDHGGHASFVDYDGQVFIPILNITFPFWSAFYCTIAQITYLQNQAQKHNTDWQKKMILCLLFISKCYLKMIVDWGKMSTKSSSFSEALKQLCWVLWRVMKSCYEDRTPNGTSCKTLCSSSALARAWLAYKYKCGRKTAARRSLGGRAATKMRGLMMNTSSAWSGW